MSFYIQDTDSSFNFDLSHFQNGRGAGDSVSDRKKDSDNYLTSFSESRFSW